MLENLNLLRSLNRAETLKTMTMSRGQNCHIFHFGNSVNSYWVYGYNFLTKSSILRIETSKFHLKSSYVILDHWIWSWASLSLFFLGFPPTGSAPFCKFARCVLGYKLQSVSRTNWRGKIKWQSFRIYLLSETDHAIDLFGLEDTYCFGSHGFIPVMQEFATELTEWTCVNNFAEEFSRYLPWKVVPS